MVFIKSSGFGLNLTPACGLRASWCCELYFEGDRVGGFGCFVGLALMAVCCMVFCGVEIFFFGLAM